MAPRDVLIVPKFNFDVTVGFDELTGRRLVSSNPKVAEDLFLLAALQNNRFQMDEKGVRLRSEVGMGFGCAAATPPRGREFIFDKPFLVLMQRKGEAAPYFALWAGSAELMVGEGRGEGERR
jgi:hypothetical protein